MKLKSIFKQPLKTLKESARNGDFIKFTPVIVTSTIFYYIEKTLEKVNVELIDDNRTMETFVTGETFEENPFLNGYNDV